MTTIHPAAGLLFTLVLGGCPVCFAQGGDGELLWRESVQLGGEEAELLTHPSIVHGSLVGQVRFYRIQYRSDGMSIGGCLIEPAKPGMYPAIIYNHGGNRDFGALALDLEMLQLGDLAAHGYVVAASQYRGVAGGPGRDEFGGSDVRDVLNLIPLLESRRNVERDRIGMIGYSRGGMMTYLALVETSRIRAAVVLGGSADLVALGRRRPEMYKVYDELIAGDPEQLRTGLIARSAVYWADRLPRTTPLLLLHGTADTRVSPLQSLRMAERLLDAGIPFELVLLQGVGHSWDTRAVTVRIHEWFDRFLKADGG